MSEGQGELIKINRLTPTHSLEKREGNAARKKAERVSEFLHCSI